MAFIEINAIKVSVWTRYYLQLCKVLFTNFMCDMRKLCKTSFTYRNFTLINSIKLSFGFTTSKFTLTTSWCFVVVYTKIGKWWMKTKTFCTLITLVLFSLFSFELKTVKITVRGKRAGAVYIAIYTNVLTQDSNEDSGHIFSYSELS